MCVKNSVHAGGVCPIACRNTPPPRTRGIHPTGSRPPGSRHSPQGADTHWDQRQTPPPAQCMLGDTGNKRAVCILLECILVWVFISRYKMYALHMFHFAYACKTKGKNGISRLISPLCVNCLISIPEYSRIIDYSIIWMCIWCGLLQKLYKIKKAELLNSKVYSKV